jgi:adenylate cyclase
MKERRSCTDSPRASGRHGWIGPPPPLPPVYRFATFTLDFTRGFLTEDGHIIALRPKALEALKILVERAGTLVAKAELMAAVWPAVTVTDESLTRCISDVRAALRDKEQRLIETVARRGYVLVAPVEYLAGGAARLPDAGTITTSAAAADTATPASPPKVPEPERASIAVLPFDLMGADPSRDYLADGIVEDITTELARFSQLAVIARNSSFRYKGRSVDVRRVGRELGARYVLEGSLRQDGRRLRITAQLIEAETRAHRWAERYDRELESVFELQDEISRTIAAVLTAQVSRAEMQRSALRPPETWLAYDFFLQAAALYHRFSTSRHLPELSETERLVDRSLALDPGYARAHALAATVNHTWHVWPGTEHYLSRTKLHEGVAAARRAIGLDSTLPEAHEALGINLSFLGEHDAALAALQEAHTLNPSYSSRRFGMALYRAGEHARAVVALREHMRLDPFYAPAAAGWLGLSLAHLGQFEEAVRWHEEHVARSPDDRHARTWFATTLARKGDLARAREQAAEALRIDPGYRIGKGLIGYFKRPEDHESALAALRLAGLPE